MKIYVRRRRKIVGECLKLLRRIVGGTLQKRFSGKSTLMVEKVELVKVLGI
jgi:hypothetical protein